jgi:hypothetical protein
VVESGTLQGLKAVNTINRSGKGIPQLERLHQRRSVPIGLGHLTIARGRDADFDLAILDANLNGQPVSPVANALVARFTARRDQGFPTTPPPAAEFAMLWPRDASLNQRSRYARHL